MTDWVPPMDRGPLYSQTCWSFIRLQYASLWNHVTQRNLHRSGPWLAVSTRSQGPWLSWARVGGGVLDTCCKSTAQTVQTRAVNQQARTITPKEAKTLLSVNTHHNSRLFNLDRTGSNLKGLSAQYLSQTEKLHYLMRTNSIIHDRILARAQ